MHEPNNWSMYTVTFRRGGKMLNLAIRIYYIAVPACMVLQTIVLGYMALVLNKISKRRRNKK